MRHKSWSLRVTLRGRQLIRELRTPSGAHAGECVIDLPAQERPQLSAKPASSPLGALH